MTDFYQSPGDKVRFDILLKTLREGGVNLAILGNDDIALAQYARRIVLGLREPGKIEVELWSSADSEKLVQRFNDILAELSVDQALDKAQRAPTKRYMVFPDAQAVSDIDLQLLARLINGFPASNIHAVLLLNRADVADKKLSAFGKNIMQWVLEPEHPDTVPPPKMQRIETRDEVSDLAPDALAISPVPKAVVQETPAHEPLMEVRPENAPSWEAAPAATPRQKNARLGWGILAVVLVSLTLSAVLYREQLQQEFKKMQDYLGQSSKASQPKEAPAIASPSVAMSSTTTLPVKADESLIPDKEVLVKEAEKTPVVPEPASAAPAVAVATAPTPAASVASPPAAAAAPTVSSDDKAWVNKLPSSQWVLQHAAFDTKNEIESLRVSQASFSDGKVLKTQRKSGAAYFILVTGPYATRAEAENLIKTNPAMAKSWLRSTKSLKSQFQD